MTDGELLAELDTAASCLREGRPYRPHDSQARAQPGDHGLFDHMSNEELLQALRESEARMAEEDPDALLVRGPGKRFS
jgi:hypothetical protein